MKLSAVEAAPIVQQANVHKRESDAFRLEASKLEARVETVAPVVAELDAILAQLSNQKKDLEEIERSIADRHAASRAEASEARAGAAAASVKLEEMVDRLAKLRGEDLEQAYARALALFNKAVTAAKAAQTDAPASGKAMLGDAQRAVAYVYWQKAQGLGSFAGLMNAMASAQPPLGKSSAFAEQAKAAIEAKKEALQNANTAIEAARAAFGSVRLQGEAAREAKEKLDRLALDLEMVSKATADESLDLASIRTGTQASASDGDMAAPAEPAETAAAAPTDPELLAAVEAYLAAVREERFSDAAAMMHSANPDAKAAMEGSVATASKMRRADKACQAKFGVGMAEVVATIPGVGAMIAADVEQLKVMQGLQASSMTITQNGEEAEASAEGLKEPMRFRRVDGRWYLYDPKIEQAGPMLAQLTAMMEPMGQAVDEWATAVEAGEYADARAAGQGFMAKLQPIMMRMMQPPPGGG
jgi:hypothetical protein